MVLEAAKFKTDTPAPGEDLRAVQSRAEDTFLQG